MLKLDVPVEFDRAVAAVAGAVHPDDRRPGNWVIETGPVKFPVNVARSTRCWLAAHPEEHGKLKELICWVKQDRKKHQLVLTVISINELAEDHRDTYIVRGTIERIEEQWLLVRVQPAGETLKPFRLSLQLKPKQRGRLQVGQRLEFGCYRKTGKLYIHCWGEPGSEEAPSNRPPDPVVTPPTPRLIRLAS